jgi:tripartite-type tricarboxylate transporter receptor subunit TctC
MTIRALLILAGVLSIASHSARAQTVAEEPYKGATIRMISGAGAASGYTIWTHFLAKHLAKHIPGNPSIVVETMAGAGGLIATNWGYNVAPKDGKTIISVNRETAAMSILKAKGVQFDATRFHWLGSPTSETNICAVSKDAAWRTPEDYRRNDLLVGTDGVGSGMHIYPVALNQILGVKFRVIDGYGDSGLVLVAADRGEIDGSCQSAETLLRARGDRIRSGSMRVVLQAGLKPDKRFPDVPFVLDLADTEDQRQALRFLFSSLGFGRPFVLPPGTPIDRVTAMQKAFTDTFSDPDFIQDAARQGYDLEPTSGAEMAKLVDQLAATPRPIIERVGAMIEPPGSR